MAAIRRILKVLPGLLPILGSTEQEALDKETMLNELLHPAVGIWMLSEQMQFRLYDYPQDGPLPTADIRASGSAFTPRVVQPDGARRPRGPVGARLRHPGRRQPLAWLVRRHAGAARRSHAALAGRGRLRRLQHHAGLFPGRAGTVRRPGRADAAAARAVPHATTPARRCAIISACRCRPWRSWPRRTRSARLEPSERKVVLQMSESSRSAAFAQARHLQRRFRRAGWSP